MEMGKRRDGEIVASKTSRKYLVHWVSSQRLVWIIVPKVRVRVMGMAEIISPLTIWEGKQHVSLGLAHCERVVKFMGADGPFQCCECMLPLWEVKRALILWIYYDGLKTASSKWTLKITLDILFHSTVHLHSFKTDFFFIRSDFLGRGMQGLPSILSASHTLMSLERFWKCN